ncbi:GNAT family N-acetyltransferase [Ruminococcaceae bacterium OttesenSCG-928-L11]|nr:GNAT family N-acetyltransferase [Ruminococcaceae bacterium OttesenSCG-928-L11]
MIPALQTQLPQYTIQRVAAPQVDAVMALYQTNLAYFMLTDEEPPSREHCLEDIRGLPPGLEPWQKSFIGFWSENEPVAVLDFLTGYPDATCCWIGLLLVHQGLQGQGIGRAIAEAAEQAAVAKGYNRMGLGVIASNTNAIAFWERLGYRTVRHKQVERGNKPAWDVLVMEKPL